MTPCKRIPTLDQTAVRGVIANLPDYTQNTRITATGELMVEVMNYERLNL